MKELKTIRGSVTGNILFHNGKKIKIKYNHCRHDIPDDYILIKIDGKDVVVINHYKNGELVREGRLVGPAGL